MPKSTVADELLANDRVAGRGRPRSTSARALELIALDLFTRQGFHGTTVDQIATSAGVSRRTFFRYFDSKSAVLWSEFDAEVSRLRATLEATPAGLPFMDAVRMAVVSVNHYRAEDVPELRARIDLIGSVPELAASAAEHYDAWERAISEFVAGACGQAPDALFPTAVGRATLAVCHAAYDRWARRADADLTVYLDAALRALAAGFADPMAAEEDSIPGVTINPRRRRVSGLGPSRPPRGTGQGRSPISPDARSRPEGLNFDHQKVDSS